MSIKINTSNRSVGEEIRKRRLELGYTMEEFAKKANIGTKTLSRYESGESIRSDKVRTLLKALKWSKLPIVENESYDFDLEISSYRQNQYWSNYLENQYGKFAAASFVIGAEILLDSIEDDMRNISSLPKNSHLGQLDYSNLLDMLPEQFLMEYNYEFLYAIRWSLLKLIISVKHEEDFRVHTVMDELLIKLIVEESEILMEEMINKIEEKNEEYFYWKEWAQDICEDDDLYIFLYENLFLEETDTYHFKNWLVPQFFMQDEN